MGDMSTREVVGEAKDCVTNYYDQSRGLLRSCTTAISRLIPMKETLRQIDAVKSKMIDHLKEKDEKAKGIYINMERLRFHHRMLLDNYTIEEHKSVAEEADKSVAAQNQKPKKPSTSLDELMKKSKDLFSSMEERWSIYLLLPLHAFLKDLNQLQLIADAEVCISNYSWWFPFFSILKKNIPIVTHRFRKGMKRIITDFDDLLKTKAEYNFSFTDKVAERSPIRRITDDKTITSAIASIDSKLKNLDQRSKVAEMKLFCQSLEYTHAWLRTTEETAGRNACLDQLKSISWEFDNFLEWYMNRPVLERLEIRNAIFLLRRITRICRIERQRSTEVVGLKNEVQDLVSKLITGYYDISIEN